jgi:U3 small nucleolar RNA-associated protein 12
VLNVLKQVKSSELESSLLVLPFTDAMDFLRLCNVWLEKGWEIEVVSRCALFLVRIHFNQITSSKLLLPIIDSLRQILPQRILDLKVSGWRNVVLLL